VVKARLATVIMVLMVVVMGLFLVVLSVDGADQPSFALGITISKLWVPESSEGLGMLGGALDIILTPTVSMTVGYSTASVSFLGFEIASLWILDIATVVETTPEAMAGLYVMGGGGYMEASVLGMSAGGVFLGGGVGLRISPTGYARLFIQYKMRWIESLMNAVEGGFSIVF